MYLYTVHIVYDISGSVALYTPGFYTCIYPYYIVMYIRYINTITNCNWSSESDRTDDVGLTHGGIRSAATYNNTARCSGRIIITIYDAMVPVRVENGAICSFDEQC